MANTNRGVTVNVMKNKNTSFDSMQDKDFDEEDVWSTDEFGSKIKRASSKDSSESSFACHLPAAPRKISMGNNSTPFAKGGSSAPMNIPDWSKVYGKKINCMKEGSMDDGVSDDEMVPPHEWIARKLARSQISSFSVCEGIGRTLKGRDLSKVRNAILTKTGFIE